MEWDNGATIGFSAAGNPYANHDPSSNAVACVNTPESDWSNVVYLLSSPAPRESLSATHVTVCSWFVYVYAEGGLFICRGWFLYVMQEGLIIFYGQRCFPVISECSLRKMSCTRKDVGMGLLTFSMHVPEGYCIHPVALVDI